MKHTEKSIIVTEYNIDGFLKLSENKNGISYLYQKNQIEYNTQWKLAINADLAILELKATFEPKSKLDFSTLALYKATKDIEFKGINDLENIDNILKDIVVNFHLDLAREYNNKQIGTKINVPFPKTTEQEYSHLVERLKVSLHKALERLKKM